MKNVGIIILAAGNSSRLGQPKQLLAYKETTLLKNTVKEASLVPHAVVIVVTGSNYELIEKELDNTAVKISFNPDWETGMSSSIVKGLKDLLRLQPDIQKCIFTVCDQPFVTGALFTNLVEEDQKSGKGITASEYTATLGTPVLFDKKYFAELLELKGQDGAKKIITKYLDDTAKVSFEKGSIDIDTEDDYNKLISEF